MNGTLNRRNAQEERIDLKYGKFAEVWGKLEGKAVKTFEGTRRRQTSPTLNFSGSLPGSYPGLKLQLMNVLAFKLSWRRGDVWLFHRKEKGRKQRQIRGYINLILKGRKGSSLWRMSLSRGL